MRSLKSFFVEEGKYKPVEGKAKEVSTNEKELSFYKSPLYSKSQLEPYNPDELMQKRGGLDIYTRMKTDDQVKAVLVMKKYAALSGGWHIEGTDEKRVEFLQKVYAQDTLRIMDKLYDVLSALEYGFSVSEIMYLRATSGELAGKIILSDLKTRPPHSFEFGIDDHGNLNKLTQHTQVGDKDFPIEKFIIYTYMPEFGGHYGNSDLRAAYRAWFSKDITIKFRNMYNEKFGMPTIKAKYPPTLSEPVKADLEKIIKNIQSMTAIKIPEGVEIDLLESTRKSVSEFSATIKDCDTAIARAVLVPNLMGFTDTKSGSYALGKTQFDVFLWILAKIRTDNEMSIAQISKRLIDLNFGPGEYPKWKMNPMTQQAKEDLMASFVDAVDKGVITPTFKDEEHVRDILSFPKVTEAESAEAKKEWIPRTARARRRGQEGREDIDNLRDEDDDKKEFAEYKIKRAKTEYEKKVDFEEISTRLNSDVEEIMVSAGTVIMKTGVDIIDRIMKNKIVPNNDMKAIEALTLKYMNEFRIVWRDALPKIFKDAKAEAIAEVKRKKFVVTVGNLPPKEALEYFERISFQITGVEKSRILNSVKQILYNAMKLGKNDAEVQYELELFFANYTVLQKTIGPGGVVIKKRIEKIPGRLTVITRTNVADAFNQGRLTGFQDPSVKDLIAAYQYSAIMDDNTTEFCIQHDGKIFQANDPYIAQITPANHFQCRSMWIPILNDERYKINKHPAIEPAKGFA